MVVVIRSSELSQLACLLVAARSVQGGEVGGEPDAARHGAARARGTRCRCVPLLVADCRGYENHDRGGDRAPALHTFIRPEAPTDARRDARSHHPSQYTHMNTHTNNLVYATSRCSMSHMILTGITDTTNRSCGTSSSDELVIVVGLGRVAGQVDVDGGDGGRGGRVHGAGARTAAEAAPRVALRGYSKRRHPELRAAPPPPHCVCSFSCAAASGTACKQQQ